jgi:hypothetical protein
MVLLVIYIYDKNPKKDSFSFASYGLNCRLWIELF